MTVIRALARKLAAGGLRPSGALRWSCSAPLRTRAERRRILSRRTRDLGGLAAYTPGVTPYKTPEYHPAFEEYCETIFELREDDVDVIQARVAERLDVSRPAVSEMIRRMETQGLVTIEGGSIRLTDDGMGLAESVVRRHRLAERFLTDILDL